MFLKSTHRNLDREGKQLFGIVIEPLSITLRSPPLFKGIICNRTEYKLSLYADDLLLYITDPTFSIPAVLGILENFSTFSGYKLSLGKSECFPVNIAACYLQQSDLPFQFQPGQTNKIPRQKGKGITFIVSLTVLALRRRGLDQLYKHNNECETSTSDFPPCLDTGGCTG